MANAHGFGVLYSLLTTQSREDLESLKQSAFNMLFLFGYKQAEELSHVRDPMRRSQDKPVIERYEALMPRFEKQEEYALRFMRRLAVLRNVGGNMDLVLTVGCDSFNSPANITTWMRTRMAHAYKTYRDSSTHSRVKQFHRPPVLADAFLVIDLVMYGHYDKLFF